MGLGGRVRVTVRVRDRSGVRVRVRVRCVVSVRVRCVVSVGVRKLQLIDQDEAAVSEGLGLGLGVSLVRGWGLLPDLTPFSKPLQ